MKLPVDIANLLAFAVRDVVWFRDKVHSFLVNCGVPKSVLAEAKGKGLVNTVKLIPYVLDRLDDFGDVGEKAVRQMLTTMYYWKDMRTVAPDRQKAAADSLEALRVGYRDWEGQRKHQAEAERQMHAERLERTQLQPLDHLKLQAFREEFDATYAIQDRQERGNRFQDLMNRIFDYYCEKSMGPFKRTGEQIDGLFYFDKHWYYVEVRWKEEQANAADVSVLRDRAKSAFGGDTKALFISFNGFTSECCDNLKGQGDERVLAMDGFDLRCILDCQIAFDVLLAEKQAEIVQRKHWFVGAKEIIARRKR